VLVGDGPVLAGNNPVHTNLHSNIYPIIMYYHQSFHQITVQRECSHDEIEPGVPDDLMLVGDDPLLLHFS
jgi:hypothetical protein